MKYKNHEKLVQNKIWDLQNKLETIKRNYEELREKKEKYEKELLNTQRQLNELRTIRIDWNPQPIKFNR